MTFWKAVGRWLVDLAFAGILLAGVVVSDWYFVNNYSYSGRVAKVGDGFVIVRVAGPYVIMSITKSEQACLLPGDTVTFRITPFTSHKVEK